ncbi:putative transmembrane domain-containing protein [Neospora caninum Liverpool]|uniref:Putative transmembrane domain-containing protein n=1 Tax=Neospora caninum (strain Liverpool) TaxID=572307 RepID=F0VER6_NEOCL|nr:putative transmembrane domain-containing protein [Neospora caninum Liverpool]CBZ52210.1 putative transmembrane domain-containing protein [Neospora caninum Liverpool]|eukprot:XP_003882242.1 putative transmembrane domain-containing protein [Neospora caninum Liverpool]
MLSTRRLWTSFGILSATIFTGVLYQTDTADGHRFKGLSYSATDAESADGVSSGTDRLGSARFQKSDLRPINRHHGEIRSYAPPSDAVDSGAASPPGAAFLFPTSSIGKKGTNLKISNTVPVEPASPSQTVHLGTATARPEILATLTPGLHAPQASMNDPGSWTGLAEAADPSHVVALPGQSQTGVPTVVVPQLPSNGSPTLAPSTVAPQGAATANPPASLPAGQNQGHPLLATDMGGLPAQPLPPMTTNQGAPRSVGATTSPVLLAAIPGSGVAPQPPTTLAPAPAPVASGQQPKASTVPVTAVGGVTGTSGQLSTPITGEASPVTAETQPVAGAVATAAAENVPPVAAVPESSAPDGKVATGEYYQVVAGSAGGAAGAEDQFLVAPSVKEISVGPSGTRVVHSQQRVRAAGEVCFDACSCWPVWCISIVVLVVNLVASFVAFHLTASLYSKGLFSSHFYKGGGYWMIGAAIGGLVIGGLIGGLVPPACWAGALYLGGSLMSNCISIILLGRRGAWLGALGGVGCGGVIGFFTGTGAVGIVVGVFVGLLFGIVVGFAPVCRSLKLNERYIRAGMRVSGGLSSRFSDDGHEGKHHSGTMTPPLSP